MKDTIFIIIFGILIYLGFATIFGDNAIIGSYGATFAKYNNTYFGYISFIYLFLLLAPLYYLYKNHLFNFRRVEINIASILLFFSSLLAQSLLLENGFRGELAGSFIDYLAPYVGFFGLWIFWAIITSVSILIILDKTTNELIIMLQKQFKQKKIENLSDNNLEENIKEDIEEEKIQTEVKIIRKKQICSKIEENHEEDIDKPTYLRQKEAIKEEEKANETIKEENKVKEVEIIKKSPEIKVIKKDKEIVKKPKEHENTEETTPKIKETKTSVVVKELEENTKLLEGIEKGKVEKPINFKLPSVNFLHKPEVKIQSVDESELDEKIEYLIDKLKHFKIDGDVVRTYAGPVVSTFEFKPAANVKVSKILNLQDDLAMALSAETIRIQAPIPGKDVVGIEIPNETVETIYLRELLDSKLFQEASSPLTIALGKDIVGKPFITDLKKLPHLLIAGTTGSGKSVGINAMILSLLYKNSPDQLRLLMIDPKMLEFSIYNDIPHLLTPVITKPKEALVSLNNMVNEMERRYELMAESKTKNIENYNEKIKKIGGEFFPYIVVIIDELADLMMTSGKEVEISIARLAQKSRACGIHLIVATQRPSVDVVTGLIKANLPSRVSYRVGQKIDSKIILDQMGAESLLGRGDMLFTPPGTTGLVRLHAPWATEDEIEEITDFIKSQREPNYDKSFLVEETLESTSVGRDSNEELDELYAQAKNVILTDKKTSISYLQRKLQIGYNRSARLIEQLEGEGILSAPNTKGVREII
ncbi:MAG: DNA translocase FtsK [Campylobacterota bacterium]|nr:DNA translocase FtsK [Campylobacterota bacterium]